MVSHPLSIRFVDGACTGSERHSGSGHEASLTSVVNCEWFDALVIVHPDSSTVVQSAVSHAPWEEYLPSLIADFWEGANTNERYFRSWKVLLVMGAVERYLWTGRHLADAARGYQALHPHAGIASMVGGDRCYLTKEQRVLVDENPFTAIKSSGLDEKALDERKVACSIQKSIQLT